MAIRDWFRNEAWNSKIEAEFEKRLSRSRGRFHKAQYLKLQGLTLLASGDDGVQAKGVALLRRVVSEYPDEWTEVAHSHEILADYFKRIKAFRAAETEYREVLRYYERTPSRTNTTGLADLSFVEMILEAKAEDLYEEAASLLLNLSKEVRLLVAFNSDVFRYHATFARLLSRTGDQARAVQHAEYALSAAEIRTPQFPRHPIVGLTNPPKYVLDELQEIAASRRG